MSTNMRSAITGQRMNGHALRFHVSRYCTRGIMGNIAPHKGLFSPQELNKNFANLRERSRLGSATDTTSSFRPSAPSHIQQEDLYAFAHAPNTPERKLLRTQPGLQCDQKFA